MTFVFKLNTLTQPSSNLCIFAQMQLSPACVCICALLRACCSFVCYSVAAAGQSSGRDTRGHHWCGCAAAIVIQQAPRPHKLWISLLVQPWALRLTARVCLLNPEVLCSNSQQLQACGAFVCVCVRVCTCVYVYVYMYVCDRKKGSVLCISWMANHFIAWLYRKGTGCSHFF